MSANRNPPGQARRRLGQATTYTWLTVCVIVVCFPLYYVFEGALTPAVWLEKGLQGLVPTHLSLSNFEHATSLVPLGRQFLNSALVTLAQTTGQIVTAIMAAYALVFCRLRGTRAIFLLFLSTMMIPAETTILANYLTVAHWHLITNLTAVFLPYLVSAFSIFQFRQAFLSFPGAARGRHPRRRGPPPLHPRRPAPGHPPDPRLRDADQRNRRMERVLLAAACDQHPGQAHRPDRRVPTLQRQCHRHRSRPRSARPWSPSRSCSSSCSGSASSPAA